MADSFTANHIQGVFGKFVPVLDEAVELSDAQVQGVFGRFLPVLDEAAGVAAATAALTGTALPTATEAEIAAGGETVIITLTDDTWVGTS